MIYHKIRIISLKRLFYAAAMLMITCAIFHYIPFFDIIWPAQIKDPSTIVELYQDGITYVELTADTLYYSGYDYVENGKVTGSYYYNIYDGTCIYFLLSNTQCSGRPETLSNVFIKARLQSGGKLLSELIQQMSADLGWTPQGLSSVSSRILINAVDYLLLKHIIFFAITLLVFAVYMIIFLNMLSYMIFPLLHPSCYHLRRYGSVREQITQAEQELHEIPMLKEGIFTVTEHYLFIFTSIKLHIIPLEEIIWAYKHSNLHRFHLRKLKLTYTLRVTARKGLVFVADSQPKEDVDAVLDYISQYNPEVLIGYSKKNERLARAHQ